MDEISDGGDGRHKCAQQPKNEKYHDNGFEHDSSPWIPDGRSRTTHYFGEPVASKNTPHIPCRNAGPRPAFRAIRARRAAAAKKNRRERMPGGIRSRRLTLMGLPAEPSCPSSSHPTTSTCNQPPLSLVNQDKGDYRCFRRSHFAACCGILCTQRLELLAARWGREQGLQFLLPLGQSFL